MTSKHAKSRRTGPLSLVGGLLVASAIIRLTSSGGEAFAEAAGTFSTDPEVGRTEKAQTEDVDVGALLSAVQDREARVKEREDQLASHVQALKFAEEEIQEQMAALVAAEEQLKQTIALADVAAENDLQSLTQVYENMKPKDAAALFEEMSPEFAAGFLGMMRSDAAALIMTGLEPATAYTISVILAGRNAGVPTE